jgi:CheY-like chemotaxis protein
MKTILIVDDEADVADVVRAALQDEGYRVVVASNGAEGLERVANTHPDLLICDVMMPFMDGTAMCSRLRDDPEYQDLPIIIASVMDRPAINAKFSNHNGYLRKPFRLNDLVEMVATLTGTDSKQA